MIKIENVSKHYGSFPAVEDLTLEIKDGEIFGFLGPNGAGKSTTLKMITGITECTKGDIFVDDFSISKDTLKAKKNIGFVPDTPNVFLRLKGKEYLKLMAAIYEVPPEVSNERVKVLAHKFGLEKDLEDQIQSYSHGMRQKLIVIGVLLANPRNWILDEPMTGLDPASSFTMKEMMREHADKGNAVLFSTHVLEVAALVCDRVGIIHKGKLLFVGPLSELQKEYGNDKSLEEIFLSLTKEDAPNTPEEKDE